MAASFGFLAGRGSCFLAVGMLPAMKKGFRGRYFEFTGNLRSKVRLAETVGLSRSAISGFVLIARPLISRSGSFSKQVWVIGQKVREIPVEWWPGKIAKMSMNLRILVPAVSLYLIALPLMGGVGV